MKTKPLKFFISMAGIFIPAMPVLAGTQPGTANTGGLDLKLWAYIIFGAAGIFFLLIKYLKRNKDEMQKRIAQLEGELKIKNQQLYRQTLTDEAKQKKLAELEADREFNDRRRTTASRTEEEIYTAALKKESVLLRLPGSPDIECRAANKRRSP